jgi:hypothetical protein
MNRSENTARAKREGAGNSCLFRLKPGEEDRADCIPSLHPQFARLNSSRSSNPSTVSPRSADASDSSRKRFSSSVTLNASSSRITIFSVFPSGSASPSTSIRPPTTRPFVTRIHSYYAPSADPASGRLYAGIS